MIRLTVNTLWLIPDILSIVFLVWVFYGFWKDQKRKS